jgi:hypothetical protein
VSNSYPEGDPDQSRTEPSESAATGPQQPRIDPTADFPPAGPRYPQQLQYRRPADRDAGWHPISPASPGPWRVATADTDQAQPGMQSGGNSSIGADETAEFQADGFGTATHPAHGRAATGETGMPTYPAPDQQDVWAGNPWGARTASPISSGGSHGYGPPFDTTAARPYVQQTKAKQDPADGEPEVLQQQGYPGSASSAATRSATSAGSAASRSGSRPRNNNRLFLIITGLLALLLLATAGVVGFIKWRNDRGVPGSAPQVTASETVKGYLGALAAGNADKTIGYLAAKPPSSDLMTDSVLAASIKAAPITGIRVPAVTDPNARVVPAFYRIGNQQVRTSFTVHKVEGNFVIDNGFLTIDVSKLPHQLPIDVNGVRMSGDKITVLPGSYQLSVPNDLLDLGDDAAFTVTGPQDVPALAVDPELSAAGQQAFRAAVSAAVADCLKSTDPNAGCGLRVSARMPDGSKIVGGSVRRQLSADTKSQLDHLTGSLVPGDPMQATAALSGGTVVTNAICRTKSEKSGAKKSDSKNGKPPSSAAPQKTKTTSRPCVVSGSGTALATPVIDMSSTKLDVAWH